MKYEEIRRAADYIRDRLSVPTQVGIILGSGLGGIGEEIEKRLCIPYEEIPGFLTSTAPGHRGRLICGRLSGVPVICMQGRFHYYEGRSMENIVFPVRAMKLAGVSTLVLTNAAGGINLDYRVGDIMLIKDHINFIGNNPLIGPNTDELGPRFSDMTYAYTPALQQLALEAAQKLNIELRRGVYLGTTGPSYETPAEIRAFRILGADAVGMSTVPEVTAARHCGLEVLAFSLITNMAAGVLDLPLTMEEVIETGKKRGEVMKKLIKEVLLSIKRRDNII